MKRESGFTLIELLIVVVILGVLSLISTAILINALNKAKDSAVKANVSAASSTMLTAMSVDELTAQEAINNNLNTLNNPDGIDDNGDEIKSPYDNSIDAFVEGENADRGQVSLLALSNTELSIKGYGRSSDSPIAARTISPYSNDE